MTTCPHCEQVIRPVYKRTIHHSMLSALKAFADHPNGLTSRELASISGITYSGDHAKLRYWNLTERRGKRWRITNFGRAFLEGRVSIPKNVHLKNREVVGFSDERMFVGECNKPFNIADTLA